MIFLLAIYLLQLYATDQETARSSEALRSARTSFEVIGCIGVQSEGLEEVLLVDELFFNRYSDMRSCQMARMCFEAYQRSLNVFVKFLSELLDEGNVIEREIDQIRYNKQLEQEAMEEEAARQKQEEQAAAMLRRAQEREEAARQKQEEQAAAMLRREQEAEAEKAAKHECQRKVEANIDDEGKRRQAKYEGCKDEGMTRVEQEQEDEIVKGEKEERGKTGTFRKWKMIQLVLEKREQDEKDDTSEEEDSDLDFQKCD
ncbi:hypothetical protein THOM_0252 [Trachipleistophora hominis]|uniref:Uncharacterized protein n=1 Tax=Trachipleistophora hominis TaxID=72359 RepID=L7JZB2_TRAHO|nr:hypothetical protein THOM_0252 [Trachipleistophora hominis]